MSNTHILIGPQLKKKHIECVDVGGGLVAHYAPGIEKSAELYNITHAISGLAIIKYIPHVLLDWAVGMLLKLDWDIDDEELSKSEPHFKLVEKICMHINKKRSLKQEEELAKDLSGRTRGKASGATWGFRRDVVTPELLIEAKTTTTKEYRIKDADLVYLKDQAYSDGKIPVYAVRIQDLPDVMVVPFSDLNPECFNNRKRKAMDKSKAKTFAITVRIAHAVNDGLAITVKLPSGFYTVLGYENFLELAKRGLDD